MREIVSHMMTPHAALRIALDAESRLKKLYERISSTAGGSEMREQARALAADTACAVAERGPGARSLPLAWQEDFNGLFQVQ